MKSTFQLLCGAALIVGAQTAHAQVAGAESEGVGEIIVTAQKRDQNLQDVPLAITAVSAETLRANNVTNFVSLSNLTPGLTVSPAEGGDRVTLSIRGVGQEANQNDVAAPSVSFHQDGVYIVSPFALGAAFLDVGSLEVVRGPQGTLFGQNSTGGATNVNTVRPRLNRWEGYAQAGYGSYDYVNVAGAVNVPLGSTLAVRVSGEGIWQRGSTINVVNGQDLDDKDQGAWRAMALWQPAPNLTITGTAQQFRSNVNGAARFGLYDPTPGDRRLAQDDPSALRLSTDFYSLVVALELPTFTVKYLGSRQIAAIVRSRDNDFTNVYSSFTGVSIVNPYVLRRSYEERQDQRHRST
jgi:iron complex outermembrane receptor protein